MTDRGSSTQAAHRPRGAELEGFDDSVRSRWWDVAFVGVPLLTAGVVLVGGTEAADLFSVGALLCLMALWGLFRLASRLTPMVGVTLQIAIAVVSLVAIAASPNAGAIQALIFPLLWTLAPGYRTAIALNAVYGVSAFVAFTLGLGTATGRGPDPSTAVAAAGIAGFSLVFSIAFGTWVTRISDWGAERGRLLAELTAAQDDLAAAHRETGERAERERISRELHDTLTQSLTGLVMLGQRATRLAEVDSPDLAALRSQLALIDDVAREALGEARAVVASTASLQLDGGLGAALDLLAERMTRETGIRVSADVSATASRELEVVLLRCAQEALANVRKHSGAASARVEVRDEDDGPVLVVGDDGVGIAAVERAADRGFGLTGMSERLALVGGSLTVSSPGSGGTRVLVRVPRRTT